MVKKVYCKNCGHQVQRETHKGLRKEYPYYCPHCDENKYRFEVRKKESKTNRTIKYYTSDVHYFGVVPDISVYTNEPFIL